MRRIHIRAFDEFIRGVICTLLEFDEDVVFMSNQINDARQIIQHFRYRSYAANIHVLSAWKFDHRMKDIRVCATLAIFSDMDRMNGNNSCFKMCRQCYGHRIASALHIHLSNVFRHLVPFLL